MKKINLQNTARVILLLALAIPFVLIFWPFIVPILMAIFVAFGLEPLLSKINFKTHKRRLFSVGLFLFVILLFVIPFVAFLVRIANALKTVSSESLTQSKFVVAMTALWEKVQVFASNWIDTMGLDANFVPSKEEIISNVSPVIIDGAKLFFKALPELGLSLAVFFGFLFVLITHASFIRKEVLRMDLLPSQEIEQIIQALKSSCSMILISTILIGALQAIIVSIGSIIFGFSEFLLIFTLTFILSFIPVIGAAPVAIVLALISFVLESPGSGVGLLVVSVIAGSVDNILKPWIFSSEDKGLHPVVSLFGILGSILVFGLPGLLLGPLVMQVTLRLFPILVRPVLRSLFENPS